MDEQERSVLARVFRKLKRVILRTVQVVAVLAVSYVLVILIGLIPVNNDFQATPDGVEVFFVSTSVHADLVLPIETTTVDWRDHFSSDCFSGDTSNATHVSIGWGDRGFFVETETWDELTMSTTIRAICLPSDTCMHVHMREHDAIPGDARSVKISVAQYERLVQFIIDSFQSTGNGEKRLIKDAAYGRYDAFFEAEGKYHGFNTCNNWVGKAMKHTGIRVGWYTPLPKTCFLHLPKAVDADESSDTTSSGENAASSD